MTLSSRLVLIRANLTTWRAARERREQLRRDIACFSSAADRQDLEATLDRYPDYATQEIRDLLNARTRRGYLTKGCG